MVEAIATPSSLVPMPIPKLFNVARFQRSRLPTATLLHQPTSYNTVKKLQESLTIQYYTSQVFTFSAESDPSEEARDLPGDVGLSSSGETHQHDAEVG